MIIWDVEGGASYESQAQAQAASRAGATISQREISDDWVIESCWIDESGRLRERGAQTSMRERRGQ